MVSRTLLCESGSGRSNRSGPEPQGASENRPGREPLGPDDMAQRTPWATLSSPVEVEPHSPSPPGATEPLASDDDLMLERLYCVTLLALPRLPHPGTLQNVDSAALAAICHFESLARPPGGFQPVRFLAVFDRKSSRITHVFTESNTARPLPHHALNSGPGGRKPQLATGWGAGAQPLRRDYSLPVACSTSRSISRVEPERAVTDQPTKIPSVKVPPPNGSMSWPPVGSLVLPLVNPVPG